jgi:hypothetical protein
MKSVECFTGFVPNMKNMYIGDGITTVPLFQIQNE